jgi:hypothetical protein
MTSNPEQIPEYMLPWEFLQEMRELLAEYGVLPFNAFFSVNLTCGEYVP